MRVEQALARLGRVVASRWTLRALIGIGGTASVYKARHRNGREVALKVLHPELASHPSVRGRFLSEGYAANRVRHEGAVHILDDGEEPDGLVFLVLELLTGASLAERLSREGPLPPRDVVATALVVLDVLAAAHDASVVHRDIKPSNILLLDGGGVKVLDFGAAQFRDAGQASITQSGHTVGTPAFMAPEQAAGKPDEIDALTDIWALGATMFQLLTGRLVHPAETANASIVAAATQAAPSLREIAPELPLDVVAVVDRALSFQREERWPNARAMRAALLRTIPGVATSSSGSDGATLSEPGDAGHDGIELRLPRGRAGLVMLAAAVVVSLGFAVWLFLGPRVEGDVTRASRTRHGAAPTAPARAMTGRTTGTQPAPVTPSLSKPTAPVTARSLPSPPRKTGGRDANGHTARTTQSEEAAIGSRRDRPDVVNEEAILDRRK